MEMEGFMFEISKFDVAKFDLILARAAKSDSYLTLSANLAIEVLRELKSPGIRLLSL